MSLNIVDYYDSDSSLDEAVFQATLRARIFSSNGGGLYAKYGSLWKSMVETKNRRSQEYQLPIYESSSSEEEESVDAPTVKQEPAPSLLPAILQRKRLTLRMPRKDGVECCPFGCDDCMEGGIDEEEGKEGSQNCESNSNNLSEESRPAPDFQAYRRGADGDEETSDDDSTALPKKNSAGDEYTEQSLSGGLHHDDDSSKNHHSNASDSSFQEEEQHQQHDGDTVRGAGSSVSSGDTGTSGSTVMNYLNIGEGGKEDEEESAEGDKKAVASIAVDDEHDASESSGDTLIDFSHITLNDPTSDDEALEESLGQQETTKPSGSAKAEVVDLLDSSDDDEPIVMTESKKLAPRLSASKSSPALRKTRRRIVIESSSSEEELDGVDHRSDTGSFEGEQQQEEQDVWLVDDSNDEVSNTAEENQAINKPWMGKFLPNLNQKKAHPKGLSNEAFRKQRETLTDRYFGEFNEKAFESLLSAVEISWSNKLRTTAGLTRLKRTTSNQGVKISATIELSTKVIDNETRLRSTLMHEMCHAAMWLVDGVSRPPHGRCFQKWAHTAMRQVPDIVVTTRHDYEIRYKYAWACTTPKCGAIIKRHSRSVDVAKQCCGRCKGKLIEIEVPRENGSSTTERTPRKKAPLSEYNRFVKQHSKQVKDELVKERVRQGLPLKVSQPEVMKELGRRWKKHSSKM